jgi:radical SAM superfamily enzyme YgiQ (UPF0313 family)
MKVLLISSNTERINMLAVPWGLACVATAAQSAGYDVSFLDLVMEEDPGAATRDAVLSKMPDVIGISVRNIDDQNKDNPTFFLEKVKQTVDDCRAISSAPIVLGGAGYSIFPESALEYLGADMGIQGEGEFAFLELLKCLEEGSGTEKIPGLYLRGQGIRGKRLFSNNLDTLPFPDDKMLAPYRALGRELWLPFQSRRGCFMRCSYCSTVVIEGGQIRLRSPQLAVACLERYAAAGFNRIYFVDNNFNVPRSHAINISQEIAESCLDITWRAILNPAYVDEKLVRVMAEAGCKEVSLGFESGCERILRSMNKRFSVADIRRTAALLAKYKIWRMGFLLLGGPGETRETVLESLEFAASLDLDALKITSGIRIYPNTKLAQCAVEDGLISSDDNLLFPRFYLAPGLEGWLDETIANWKMAHPGIM